MPSSREFVDSVTVRLAAYRAVTARRMFGSMGIFIDGIMIGLVSDDVLYLKTDDGNRGDFEDAGMAPFGYLRRGQPATLPYWRVPDAVFDDPETLATWAEKAHDAARRAKAKRPRRRRG